MKRFMLLHYGFEKPTPEIMQAWNQWFDDVAAQSVEHGGFHHGGQELSHAGTKALPLQPDSITGYSIINAENIEQAEAIAKRNPFVASIRLYEIIDG